jgi:putative membrane protein
MKRLGILALFAGLALLIGLVVYEGAADIATILARAGWVLCWLVPLHLIPVALDARGWQVLLQKDAPNLAYLSWVAAVREAVNRLLPAANIGGEVLGIRLGALAVATPGVVPASVIVEVLLTMIGQYVLCVLGVVMTMFAVAALPGVGSMVTALLLSLLVPLLLVLMLKKGDVFTRIELLARRLIGADNKALADFDGPQLDLALRTLLKRYRVLAAALAWQLSGMLFGCLETWLALSLLGHPVGLFAALSIEALSLIIRSVAFFVPGGLGIQEAGIIMLGRLYGIDAEVALSMALVRRMREVTFGVPALISWQWFEARRFRVNATATLKS